MAITKVSRGLLSTGIVDNSDATAITIDSSERVGIGTSSPSAPLTVSGADGTLALFTNASDADFAFKTASGVALITPSTGTLAFGTSNTERMRIDSSGNVGINTTNFGTTGAKLQVKGTSASPAVSGSNFTGSIFSVEGTSTVNISMGTTGASAYDGWIQVHDAGTGTNYDLLLNPLGGKVGIGTTSPSSGAGWNKFLNIAGGTSNAVILDGTDSQQATFGAVDGLYIDCVGHTTGSNNKIIFRTQASNSSYVGTERMRIDSTGKVQIGTTSALASSIFSVKGAATNSQQVVSLHNPATSGTVYFMAFGTETSYTERGFITYDQSNVAFTQASDITLKENIRDLNNGLDTICKIKPRVFDWKDGHAKDSVGFIAQEVEEVKPDWVKEKDGIKMLDTNLPNTIPYLIKAIQEQQEEIEQLKQNSHAPKTIEEMEGYEDLINRIKELENK